MLYLKLFEEYVSNPNFAKSQIDSLINDLTKSLKSKGIDIEVKIDSGRDNEWYDIKIKLVNQTPLENWQTKSKEEKIQIYKDNFTKIGSFLDTFLNSWNQRLNKTNLFIVHKKCIFGSGMGIENISNVSYLIHRLDKGLMNLELVVKSKKFLRIKPTKKVLHFTFKKNRDYIKQNGITRTNNEKWTGDNPLDIGDLYYGIDEGAVYAIQDFRETEGFDSMSGLIRRLFGGYNEFIDRIDAMGWTEDDILIDCWEIDTQGLGYKWFRDSNLDLINHKSKQVGASGRGSYDWIMTYDGDIPSNAINLVKTFNPIK
jgi:hypothetical protein